MKKSILPPPEGTRVWFSEVGPKDFPEIVDCLKHTMNYFQFASGYSDPNGDLVEAHYRETLRDLDRLFWAIREKAGRKPLVGFCDIRLNHPSAEEATVELLLVDHRRQNRGFGHEALDRIEPAIFGKMRLIRLGVDPKNTQGRMFWERENYSLTRNPAEPDSTQLWYAKSRNWYERLKVRGDGKL